ncbi:MAG TPA: cytochrome ubiquinol oxidase subunit I, partial [Acidimicrobiales bacterium]|nr:cytochrome ubiquinol oxidase subunit I [Acidimicrobiales bacterium]
CGALASFGAVVAWWFTRKGRELPRRYIRTMRLASLAVIPMPFLANAFGWIFTEMGRQPWVVAPNPDGLPEVRLFTADAASNSVSSAMVLITLVGFTLLYGALMVVELFLLRRYISAGPEAVLLPGEVAAAPGPGSDDTGDDDHRDDGGRDDGGRPDGPDGTGRPPTEEADVLAFAY